MPTWRELLAPEIEKPYFIQLNRFIAAERSVASVYPSHEQLFSALRETPFDEVRVVILGQDPYHGEGQAHGMSFSVLPPTPPPPSLKNIFKELIDDVGIQMPTSGYLLPWARQGVLLLNTVLTVRASQAGSHRGKGWEEYTDQIIRLVASRDTHTVFILWGNDARKKKDLIQSVSSIHTIIESAHPSPLSAHAGFWGTKPFSRTNTALGEHAQDPIDWKLP